MIDVLELLGGRGLSADSAIILTYELHFPLYDGWIRRRLHAAGAETQLVFCDMGAYQQELKAITTTRFLGRHYSVTPVQMGKAFHPKVYLLLGRSHGRLVVGSGNATVGGLLRNAEVFGSFDFSADTMIGPHPAFALVVGLVRLLAERSSSIVRRQLDRSISRAPWLESPAISDGRTILIGGPGRVPILDQIKVLLGDRRPKSAIVVSSSFDRKLAGLRRLAALVPERRLRCILQPERAQIDGDAVKRLGDLLTWHRFVDPYPEEKKKRRDVRAHAKLLVIDCGAEELVIFGSANASSPALLESGNLEVGVATWSPTGTTISRLGLEASLRTRRVREQLVERQWEEESDSWQNRFDVALLGAVPERGRVALTLEPNSPPVGARLEVAEAPDRPALLAPAIAVAGDLVEAETGVLPREARVVRLIDQEGKALSNYAALTWPEVAERRGSSGLGSRAESAIAAMQDGVVLGTVIFEVLNQVPDFEVVLAPAGTSREGAEPGEESGVAAAPEDRPTSSFYTNAATLEGIRGAVVGDRADLDLLASLVQPLNIGGLRPGSRFATEEDEEDDSALSEEEEARTIAAQGGVATGDEGRTGPSLASREALERASRRVSSRLRAAACAAEKCLDQTKQLASVPASVLARQIWMAHIGAFLCGRFVAADDGKEVLCVEPRDFAGYIIRICRALAGGMDGGLMHLVPDASWQRPDGDTLKRGLAFLWTCAVWATHHLESIKITEPLGVWEVVPRLIAGRFIGSVQAHVAEPDMKDLPRRLPAVIHCGAGMLNEIAGELTGFSAQILLSDRSSATGTLPRCGELAIHPVLGVTVVLADPAGKLELLDLSRSDDRPPRKFKEQVTAASVVGWNSELVRKRLQQLRDSDED